MDRSSFPRVSDTAFEAVLFDIENFPMSSMKACAKRTGLSYRIVAKAVQYMAMEGSLTRRRIGKGAGRGIGSTYANLVLPSRL
jgi:molybdenum-dependent DNA-binding transcriptional regulator ModE